MRTLEPVSLESLIPRCEVEMTELKRVYTSTQHSQCTLIDQAYELTEDNTPR